MLAECLFEEVNVTCMYVDFLMYLWGMLGIDVGISCGRKDRDKESTLMLLVANLAKTKCASVVKNRDVQLSHCRTSVRQGL